MRSLRRQPVTSDLLSSASRFADPAVLGSSASSDETNSVMLSRPGLKTSSTARTSSAKDGLPSDPSSALVSNEAYDQSISGVT